MTEIRDGDAYAITLPDDARPCIVYPAGLMDRSHCPPDAKPLATSPAINPDSHMLALGSVSSGDAVGTVIVTATQLADNAEPADLHEFGRGLADGLVKSRQGAKLHGEPDVQSRTMGGVHVARIAFDIDGLSDRGIDHAISYSSWSKTNDYTLTFLTAKAHAAAIDALADRTAATLREAEPAPGHQARLGHRVARVAVEVVGVLLVSVVVWTLVTRARRKRA
jgi:hypothetical protein